MGTGPLGLGILSKIGKPSRRLGGVNLKDGQRVFLQQVAMDLAAKGIRDPTQSQIRAAMRHRLERNERIAQAVLAKTPNGDAIRSAMAAKVYHAIKRRKR